MDTLKCDLLVLGSGMSGLCAAGYAADQGANVVVIEKADHFGGSAILSSGGIWTATSQERMNHYSGGNPDLNAVILNNYPEGMRWMRRRSISMNPAQQALHGRGYVIDMAEHLKSCIRSVEQRGGHIVYETETESLLRDDAGSVVGARTLHRDGCMDVYADNTVLATGGFPNSPELRSELIHPNALDNILLRCNTTSRGDGIRLALEAGASLSPPNPGFYGHLVSESPEWGRPELFMTLSQYHSENSLLINESGNRFCDESLGDHTNTYEVLSQTNARAICFWDSSIHQKFACQPFSKGLEQLDKFEIALRHGANGAMADSLEEIGHFAVSQGFNGTNLCETVRRYNAQCRDNWESLSPGRAESATLQEAAPFYALVVRPAITHTHRGIAVDQHARVLREDGAPVQGLLAAGVDAGGVYGRGYCGGLALAMGFGLQAARTAGYWYQ